MGRLLKSLEPSTKQWLPALLVLLAGLLLSCLTDAAQSAPARPSKGALAASPKSASKPPKVRPRKPSKPSRPAAAPVLPQAEIVQKTDEQRAAEAFEAMQQHFYTPTLGLYVGEPYGYSYLWPFSQALTATTMLAEVPSFRSSRVGELAGRLSALQLYWDPDNSEEPEGSFTSTLPAYDSETALPLGPGGTKYYDDNEWVGLELLQAYRLTDDVEALDQAEQIMAFVQAGWQASPKLVCPGGVPFSNAGSGINERNLATNAPASELADELYSITLEAQYLTFAEMTYNWARACLLQPEGLYADHIGNKGKIAYEYWSYNQGAMIGAGVELYQSTGDSTYLEQARQTAAAALSHFSAATLHAENPFFVAVYFRSLLYLDSLTGEAPGRQIAQEYVEYLWQHDRSAEGVYSIAGLSSPLLGQAAIVEIYSLLCSAPSTYF